MKVRIGRGHGWIRASFIAGFLAVVSCQPTSAPLSGDSSPSSTTTVAAPAPPAEQQVVTAENLASELIQCHWNREAANAVAAVTADWFAILQRNHSPHYHLQLELLKALGSDPKLMPLLRQRPETAGLLAGAKPADRALLAKTLMAAGQAGPQYDQVAGLYVRHAAPADAAALAEALDRHRDLICRLQQRGQAMAEYVFLFDHRRIGGADYDQWLHGHLESMIDTANDEALASFLNLALACGPDLRDRLAFDDAFRRRFDTELWPKLRKVAAEQQQGPGAYEVYMDEPHLWDLLALPQGEDLLRRWGLAPVELLCGKDAYPPELRDLVVTALLGGDNITIQALIEGKFRHEPLFQDLLKRPLDPGKRAKAINVLLEADSGYPAKLAYFGSLSDDALARDLGEPPSGLQTWLPLYSVYHLSLKIYDGRDTTWGEWFEPGFEVVTIVIPVGPAGKVGAKVGGEVLATTLRSATRQLGKEIVGAMTKKQLARWTVSASLATLERQVNRFLLRLDKLTSLDITQPVKFLFRYSHVGRETFKRLTSLEARLFMRHDAKVFVGLGKWAAGEVIDKSKDQLKEQVKDLAPNRLGKLAEEIHDYLNEGAVQLEPALINEVKPSKTRKASTGSSSPKVVSGPALGNSADDLQAWRRNVAAWWLLHASDMTDLKSGNPVQNPAPGK